MFDETMKNTTAGINHIKPFLSSTPKQIVDLANAMKQLDAELIAKEEQINDETLETDSPSAVEDHTQI